MYYIERRRSIVKALLEVLKLDVCDIVTASGCSEDDGGTPIPCDGDDDCE